MTKNKLCTGIIILAFLSVPTILCIQSFKDVNSKNQTVSSSASPSPSEDISAKLESSKEEARKEFLEGMGLDPNNINKEDNNGTLTKTVKQYKTLAEAENDMGYYFGLHNTLECYPAYQLIGMYKIGNADWYQAIYADSSNEGPNIIIKVTNKDNLDSLILPYNKDRYNVKDSLNVNSVTVNIESSNSKNVNVAYFKLQNGRSYVIYSAIGISNNIANEIIENNMSMDDWQKSN